jgi:hypothetical protein
MYAVYVTGLLMITGFVEGVTEVVEVAMVTTWLSEADVLGLNFTEP